jgi:hypothetical protein
MHLTSRLGDVPAGAQHDLAVSGPEPDLSLGDDRNRRDRWGDTTDGLPTFPDTNSLFDACTAHWAAQQQLPDPDAWLLVHEPRDRLRTGLSDLYRCRHSRSDPSA